MRDALYKSLILHTIILILLVLDIPFFFKDNMSLHQVPIIVDLKNVKIAEMTNLPPKAKKGQEDKKASTIKRKIENYTKEETPKPKVEPKKEPPKEQPKEKEVKAEDKKDFLVAPKPEAKPKPEPKKKKEEPKKEEPKKAEDSAAPKLANPLKSLLASVDALEKNIGETSQTATLKDTENVNNMGIEGGTEGSYFSELSISETDLIAGRLRACWNLDPGAMGIKDMIIEIRAYLNQDGSVKDVKILDTSRYSTDTHFRSVADSARRAVYICAPYTIFAEKYADKYSMWKTMLLRFNPLDGEVK